MDDDSTRKAQTAGASANSAGSTAASTPLTPVQWLICAVACLGFAFDLYETLMTPLIVRPVLATLGTLKQGTPEFNLWVGLFFALPGVAGGLFGLLGGYLTDFLGRRRILVWSILLYAFSACAASFATSIHLLLILRCTTWIGVSVEHVAAVTWLAELFPNAKQRESVLGYTQAAFGLGGLMVTGAYYLAVTYGEHLPTIHGSHEAWRYTLLSGLIPAIPLMLVRPFLPESPVWRDKKSKGTLKRPSIAELFQPALRKTTLLGTLLVACCFALPYGAIQHTPRIVPGLNEVRTLAPRLIEQTVSNVQLIQELGGLAGRLLFAFLVIRIVTQQRRLRILLVPALLVFSWLFFFAETHGLLLLKFGVFFAQILFNGLISFWGNYLPRVYPTHLRGTGESFAINIGGRAIGVSAALITTTLSNFMRGGSASVRLAYSAGTVAVFVLTLGLMASFWLQEPKGEQLPD
ncbi:MAG TPA: MFS transporter [Candidatus Sulfotelmatobacter sp.]